MAQMSLGSHTHTHTDAYDLKGLGLSARLFNFKTRNQLEFAQ